MGILELLATVVEIILNPYSLSEQEYEEFRNPPTVTEDGSDWFDKTDEEKYE